MRIFCKQTNLIYTDPMIDKITQTPVTNASVTCNLYDSNNILVTNSNITLPHTIGGVYQAIMPVLTSLEDKVEYKIELDIKVAGVSIWYFKGPITAIIRDS